MGNSWTSALPNSVSGRRTQSADPAGFKLRHLAGENAIPGSSAKLDYGSQGDTCRRNARGPDVLEKVRGMKPGRRMLGYRGILKPGAGKRAPKHSGPTNRVSGAYRMIQPIEWEDRRPRLRAHLIRSPASYIPPVETVLIGGIRGVEF